MSLRSTSEVADFKWMHLLLAPVVCQNYIVAVYFQKYAFLLVRSGCAIDNIISSHSDDDVKVGGCHCSLVACHMGNLSWTGPSVVQLKRSTAKTMFDSALTSDCVIEEGFHWYFSFKVE